MEICRSRKEQIKGMRNVAATDVSTVSFIHNSIKYFQIKTTYGFALSVDCEPIFFVFLLLISKAVFAIRTSVLKRALIS